MKTIKSIVTTVLSIIILASLTLAQPPKDANQSKYIDRMQIMIQKGDYKQLKSYLNQGANVNAVDEVGNTPLHFASKIGDKKTIHLILEMGANVNPKNATGTTPLMIAAKYGNEYAVKTLMNHGADPTILNNAGYSAFVFAKVYKHDVVLRILKNQARIVATP